MNQLKVQVLVLVIIACLGPVARAKGRHRLAGARSHGEISLRAPVGHGGRGHLLDGKMLTMPGPFADQKRVSALAATSAAVRAIRQGVFAGTMRTDGDDSASGHRLSWTAGALPLTTLPTVSSLVSYNCHVADRLPGDPATVYRFVLLRVRF